MFSVRGNVYKMLLGSFIADFDNLDGDDPDEISDSQADGSFVTDIDG